jgi:O-antigen/teichoic acid export membrane protein
MNPEQQSSYRQIFKATGLFGGVQVIIVLISMVRTKFVAVLLGTSGVGILNLFNSPIGLITSLTGLGISYSAIRDISESAGSGDENRLARTLISFRRLVLFTGLLGMLITIILAPWLSKWSFGDTSYTWAFVWLSVTLLINAISGGQKALLQGMRKLQSMAKATVIGSFLGLFTSIPLYYFYGTQGIVPSVIISGCIALLLSWYFAKQIPVAKIAISYKESLKEGKGFIKLGIIFSISSQIGGLVSYLIIAFISHIGGVEQVGLYTAGMSFIGTYVGLVFTAMGTDYYPKLAAISKDNTTVRTMVNQQAKISVLIIFPIVLFLLVSMPLVTKVFLTAKFVGIIPFVNLTVLGVIIQAVSYSIGYISFAKGDSKFFFWFEGIFGGILKLTLSITGYTLFGLIGIGLAYITQYFFYLVVLYVLIHKRYEFSFDKDLYIILFISVLISLLAYFSTQYLSSYKLFFVLIMLLIGSVFYSFKELNNRMDLKPIIVKYMNKFLKRKNKDNAD